MNEPLTTERARRQMLRNKYRTAIYDKRCICPHCQTGKDSLRLYPDYCPHIESLKTDGEQFRCPFFLPLEGKSPKQIRQAVGLEPVEKSYGEILKTEYCERFDKIRKDMMVMSFYKYGPLKDNYGTYKCMDALGNIEKRLAKYRETGNTEFLADVANFAMLEFMHPSIEGARYTPTDSGACEIAGFSINEIRNYDKEE